VRLLSLAAAFVLAAAAAPAGAAPPAGSAVASVLLVTDVGEGALRTMPAPVWRRLARDYVGAGSRSVAAEDGTALPDEARCRAANARYAVFASFDRAMRLPGLAQENDRAYGVARFTVRNCATGTVAPPKVVRVESEPIPQAAPADADAVAQRAWETAIRAALAHDPLVLSAPVATSAPPAAASFAPIAGPSIAVARSGRIARVVSVEGNEVYVDNTGAFAQNQVLRAYENAAGKPYAQPVELVVVEITKRFVIAAIVGRSAPHVGDHVEALPPDAK